MSWDRLATATKGRMVGDPPGPVRAISTDTRNLRYGDVFLALEGDRFDGHAFLAMAAHGGASGAVVREGHPLLESLREAALPCLRVKDTLTAYGDIAAAHAATCKARRVGITGSYGKTTTRGMVAVVLQALGAVCETERNYNNLVGLPMTLLRLTAEDDYLVVELGADRPGEIARLTEIARPHVAVITGVGPTHLERLGSVENVAREKAEILRRVADEPPTSVLPAQGEWASFLRRRAKGEVLTFGLDEQADVYAKDIELDEQAHPTFTLHAGGQATPCSLRAPGTTAVINALTAAAVGVAEGMSLEMIAQALAAYRPMSGRGVLRRLAHPRVTLLDSAYNASPDSMRSALETLAALPGQRRVAVLGDMLELGPESAGYHEAVGRACGEFGVDLLIAVGPLSSGLANAAGEAGVLQVVHVDNANAALDALKQALTDDDVVLVKASYGTGLGELIESLCGDEAWARGSMGRENQEGDSSAPRGAS